MALRKTSKNSNLSGVAQPLTMTRPPGLSTRRNSDRPRARSGNSIKAKVHATKSKRSSSTSRACPSITAQATFSQPSVRPLCRSSRTISGEKSVASTDPARRESAPVSAPEPAATSSAAIVGSQLEPSRNSSA
jgi:hypothetical protein